MTFPTLKIESSKGVHIPSPHACYTLNVSSNPVPALTVHVMLDGNPLVQSLGFGNRIITVSGSGKLTPQLGQVPFSERVKLYSSERADCDDLEALAYSNATNVAGRPITSGRRYIQVSIAALEAIVGQVRMDENRHPIISASYERTTTAGTEVAVHDGMNYRVGDTLYVEVPSTFLALRATFYPVWDCVLTKPCTYTTDRASKTVSWSMEFMARVDLPLGAP